MVSRIRARRPPAKPLPGTIGARAAPFPDFIEPCHPTLQQLPPQGEGWVHEIKLDGYRCQLHVDKGKIMVYSRGGLDWTRQFKPIAEAAKALARRQLIMDGEATVFGRTGLPDFQALRRELGKNKSELLTFQAFDLLYLDGLDLRDVPLVDRKRLLQELIARPAGAIHYLEHLEIENGAEVYRLACRMGLEGVVSKRTDAPYCSGRQQHWVKTKCIKSDSFPIIAFVEKLGARPRRIASLYLGRREGDHLVYAGKARTGYTLAATRAIRERLDPLIMSKSPLARPVKKPKATWVKPVLEAEVQYSGTTDDGLLREAIFKALRDDLIEPTSGRKPSRRVAKENILQLLPKAVTPSPEELHSYWSRVAKAALTYLGRRPLKLVRHVHGTTFYHKGPLPPVPPAVHRLHIKKREGGEGVRLWVDDLAGLLGLVEIGVVEVHPWAATVDDIEIADHLILDLDPGRGIGWNLVADTALRLRDLLRAEGFAAWPKLTGGKGLHVMAPLEGGLTHDAAHACGKRLALKLAEADPKRYVTSATLSKRPGKIFIDYLRNGRGTTAIGAYSPRAKAGFPVAAPVSWRDIEAGIGSDAYTMAGPPKGRLER